MSLTQYNTDINNDKFWKMDTIVEFYVDIKKVFSQIIGIPMGFDAAPFFQTCFYTIIRADG